MSLIKYGKFPATEPNQFFNDFLNNGITGFFGADFAVNQPAVNVIEDKSGFRLEVAAPGLEKENFDISVKKDHLVIIANVENEVKEDGLRYNRREFNYEKFSRSFQLPKIVDRTEIKANYENGVLKVYLPKLEEVKKTEAFQVPID